MEVGEFDKKLSSIKMELQHHAKLEFHKQFLDLTTLKVGDIVECSFAYNSGDRRKAYISTGIKKGVIKQYESGLLYIESVDPLPKSKHVTNGRSGRAYREWYEYENTHVKVEIDTIQNISKYEKTN